MSKTKRECWDVQTKLTEETYYHFSDLQIEYRIPMTDLVSIAMIELTKKSNTDVLKAWTDLLRSRTDDRENIKMKRIVTSTDVA